MPGSDRSEQRPSNKLAAICAAGIGVLLIATAIAYGLVEQASYEQDAQRQTADDAKRAGAKIQQSCSIVRKAEMPKCLSNAEAEYQLEAYQKRHDAADLVAQRKSALWTSIMGVAALIGMALSAIGVALVWITFREQRRANNLAHAEAERAKTDAAESGRVALEALATAQRNADAAAKHVRVTQLTANAQLRAYLSVKSVEMDRDTFGDEADAVMLEIVNNGQTPGTICRVQVVVDWFPVSEGKVSLLAHDGHLLFDCHNGTPVSVPMKLGEADIPHGGGTLSVAGCVDYKDVFGTKHTVTFAFSSGEHESYWDIESGARFSATSNLNAQHQRRKK